MFVLMLLLVSVIVTVWLAWDAGDRRVENRVGWSFGVFFLPIVFFPLYFAKRPLKPGEVREGGSEWNFLKSFAVFLSVLMVLTVTSVSFDTAMASATAEEAALAVVGLVLVGAFLWFFAVAIALIIGVFLKKSSMVEMGPTGPLAQAPPQAFAPQQPPGSRSPDASPPRNSKGTDGVGREERAPHRELASVKGTVNLAPQDAVDRAAAFLKRNGYTLVHRSDARLIVERGQAGHAAQQDTPCLVVRAIPQPEGGVRIKVSGDDVEGIRERQAAWTKWSESLPKKAKKERDAKSPGGPATPKGAQAKRRAADPKGTPPKDDEMVGYLGGSTSHWYRGQAASKSNTHSQNQGPYTLETAVVDACHLWRSAKFEDVLRRDIDWQKAQRLICRSDPFRGRWTARVSGRPMRLTRRGLEVRFAHGEELVSWKDLQDRLQARREYR